MMLSRNGGGLVVRSLALVGVLLSSGACDRAVAPLDVAGVYVAEAWSADNWAERLPADGFEYQIAADTLVLERDRTGVLITVWRQRSLSSGDTTMFGHEVLFTYAQAGDRINTVATGCEGACGFGPLLPSFTVVGETLYPTAFRPLPFARVSTDVP